MSTFFTSGRAIDVILAVVGLEILVLLTRHRWSGKGLRPLDLIGQLLAGALLLLAVRCALTGADYRITAALLLASLPAHLFDLARRSGLRFGAGGKPTAARLRSARRGSTRSVRVR